LVKLLLDVLHELLQGPVEVLGMRSHQLTWLSLLLGKSAVLCEE
jgi:hypothetical protein